MNPFRSTISWNPCGCAFFLALAWIGLPSNLARGSLIAYEGFNYSPGNLLGQNGGTGFSGGWYNESPTTSYSVMSGSLPPPTVPKLVEQGGHVFGVLDPPSNFYSCWMQRDLPFALGAAGTTVYLSMLLEPNGTVYFGWGGGFASLSLVQSFASTELDFGLPGYQSFATTYGLENLSGVGRFMSGVQPAPNQPVFLVMRCDFNANTSANDTFKLYVNPKPGAAEPASGTIKNDFNFGVGQSFGTVGSVAIRSGGAFSIDEIRIGTTFADVAPAVPEPTSLKLLLAGVLMSVKFVVARCKSAQEGQPVRP